MPRVALAPNNGAKILSNVRISAAVRPLTCVLPTAAMETSVIEEHCHRPAPSRFWHARLQSLLIRLVR